MAVARFLWLVLGGSSVVLAAIGAVLPLLPTTPFLILAAFAFSKSSPRLERWLIAHPRFGGAIRNWREERAIGRKPKWLATLVMALSWGVGWGVGLSGAILAVQAAVFTVVLVFLWTRSEPTRPQGHAAGNGTVEP
ncbi:YbaN family protein [Fulvimarina sp. 2208YS6-2-32]|uniref:YbaN family protein n=1 Tax=Fulvimarina uroteuthidis TaxID=3098149 RepID=A0ABU5I5U4_9HYPH|nr:YbaN family protein [Fulvimarina sp. 2208YS6-2-32]MDY8110485.1 YbaN family protein [Fulvimarina sp. 2208YS6-2-32]